MNKNEKNKQNRRFMFIMSGNQNNLFEVDADLINKECKVHQGKNKSDFEKIDFEEFKTTIDNILK